MINWDEVTCGTEVYPILPDDPVLTGDPNDEFWAEISKELLLRSEGDIRTLVFDLWSQSVAADSIMKMVGITEEELQAIIPRTRWFATKWIPCRKCQGKGGSMITVRWKDR